MYQIILFKRTNRYSNFKYKGVEIKMPTRCQIGVYENDKRIALIYRHSDGYPNTKNGVLHILTPLIKDFKQNLGYDAEYLSAQIVFRLIDNYRRYMTQAGYLDNSSKYLGFRICQEMYEDIEYFYKISEDGIEVFETPDPLNQCTWRRIKIIEY